MKRFIVFITITLLIGVSFIGIKQHIISDSSNITIVKKKYRNITKVSSNNKARYEEIEREESIKNAHDESILRYAHEVENLDMNTLNRRFHSSWSNDDMGLVGYMMNRIGYRNFNLSSFIKGGQLIFYSQSDVGDIYVYGSQENPQYLAMKMDGDNVLMLVSGKIKIVDSNVVPNEVIKLN
ncbi:hypothetical protein [Liquorilactobacillus mali]|uniref:Uncharacterized protein n=1 Tax=Liquorilactobacillus mali KCTC 3596 = DSM 20444 TaxID=1046596 RepID=A0A0R2E1I8_9LACO|nr:hypothetical protein [Liquorilactobacillus mali]KRN09363.1 hypothetical protein FD00_GL001086 [Liquorilactobacillus mali KCTC 3596 = DSM 20444]